MRLAVLMLCAACGGDGAVETPDARPVTTVDATVAPGDAAGSPDASAAAAMRGKYLVENLDDCGGCHTPRLAGGAPDPARRLAGVDCFIDVDPAAGTGCLSSRNLTNHETGLKNRTDRQIKDMFQNGVRPDGKFLAGVMPYWVFHTMTDADADAVVAYLRTVPGVDHVIAPSEPPWNNVSAAAPAITDGEIPPASGTATTMASAMRGRYLAVLACIDCHSPDLPPGSARPVDLGKAFRGRRAFPGEVYSFNLTPDATGIMGRSVDTIVRELLEGVDPGGNGICAPMPAGPMGAFGGMTDDDARDIGTYLLGLAPYATILPKGCVAPAP